MGEKKQLNVRIPLELHEKIENSGRSKVDLVTDALELYFRSDKHDTAASGEKTGHSTSNKIDAGAGSVDLGESNEIKRMKSEIDFLRAKIDEILKLFHQEQVLHIQTQRMISAPKHVEKKWWQFWK